MISKLTIHSQVFADQMRLMVMPEVNNLSKNLVILAQETVLKLVNAEHMEFANLAEEGSMSQNFVIFVQGAVMILENAGSTEGVMGGQTETINMNPQGAPNRLLVMVFSSVMLSMYYQRLHLRICVIILLTINPLLHPLTMYSCFPNFL